MKPTFEWNPTKAALNEKKHGVAFEDSTSVFDDEFAMIEFDTEHTEAEDRYRIIGVARSGRILVVSYCERGNRLRIISARKPTRHEASNYEAQRRHR